MKLFGGRLEEAIDFVMLGVSLLFMLVGLGILFAFFFLLIFGKVHP